MFNLPFTYNWLLSKLIKKNKVKTILELGCGKGDFADLVNKDHQFDITGVDIFEPYLKICKERGKYSKLMKKDLCKRLNIEDKSFDVVVCLQTIEHMDKKAGLELFTKMEKIAKKIVIVSTPLGECLQKEYDNNLHQRHLSSWIPPDFFKKGYKVSGVGLKWVYGEHSHVEERFKQIKLPLYFFSFLMNPVANIFPAIACQIIAVKRMK